MPIASLISDRDMDSRECEPVGDIRNGPLRAAAIGALLPNGTHVSSDHVFAQEPSYEALRPVAEAFITELQRGSSESVDATSAPGARSRE
jgi:hypothetical protein